MGSATARLMVIQIVQKATKTRSSRGWTVASSLLALASVAYNGVQYYQRAELKEQLTQAYSTQVITSNGSTTLEAKLGESSSQSLRLIEPSAVASHIEYASPLPSKTVTDIQQGIWKIGKFNAKRDNGRAHKGLDIYTSIGTEAAAIAAGTVVHAGDYTRIESGITVPYGNTIILQLDDGKFPVYAHLSTIDVRVGDTVTRGQIIGETGNSGNASNATGPYNKSHLHLEMIEGATFANGTFTGGAHVNPETLLPLMDNELLAQINARATRTSNYTPPTQLETGTEKSSTALSSTRDTPLKPAPTPDVPSTAKLGESATSEPTVARASQETYLTRKVTEVDFKWPIHNVPFWRMISIIDGDAKATQSEQDRFTESWYGYYAAGRNDMKRNRGIDLMVEKSLYRDGGDAAMKKVDPYYNVHDVHPIADGKVVYATDNFKRSGMSFGPIMKVVHGTYDGPNKEYQGKIVVSQYFHTAKPEVKEGQSVTTNTLLAKLSNNGIWYGTEADRNNKHVHVEVWLYTPEQYTQLEKARFVNGTDCDIGMHINPIEFLDPQKTHKTQSPHWYNKYPASGRKVQCK